MKTYSVQFPATVTIKVKAANEEDAIRKASDKSWLRKRAGLDVYSGDGTVIEE